MRFILIFLIIVALIYILSTKKTRDWVSINNLKIIGFALSISLIAIIAIKGQAGLAAITAAIIAFGERLWRFRHLLTTLVQLKRFFTNKKDENDYIRAGKEQNSFYPDQSISVKRAAEVLGIDQSASTREIREAHRRLITKLHPDKEGSDYLAALLNNARDTLIANRNSDSSNDRKS